MTRARICPVAVDTDRVRTLRKLLALGPMTRADIEAVTGWGAMGVAWALSELRALGELEVLETDPVQFCLAHDALLAAFAAPVPETEEA